MRCVKWKIVGAGDFEVSEEVAALRFGRKPHAMEAAERLFTGQDAEGPWGVLALVEIREVEWEFNFEVGEELMVVWLEEGGRASVEGVLSGKKTAYSGLRELMRDRGLSALDLLGDRIERVSRPPVRSLRMPRWGEADFWERVALKVEMETVAATARIRDEVEEGVRSETAEEILGMILGEGER